MQKNKGNAMIWTVVGILVLLVLFYWIYSTREPRDDAQRSQTLVTNFEECLAAGYEVVESFPRQCRTPEGVSYTEEASADEGADTEVDAEADADLDLDNLSK